MKKARLILRAGLLLGLAACESTRSDLARLQVFGDGQEYLVEVRESDPRRLDRSIRISCTLGCPAAVSLEEKVSGIPLGIFQLDDVDPLVFTTWGGGSTYAVRIFEVRPDRIRKVFERYTRGTPTFARQEGERLSVTTTEYEGEGAGTRRPMVARTWVWDGQRFLEAARRRQP